MHCFPDKWVHLRKSNTEPIIRIYSEAHTMQEAEDKDWNEEWEKNYFKPLVVDGRCVIASTFHTDQQLHRSPRKHSTETDE